MNSALMANAEDMVKSISSTNNQESSATNANESAELTPTGAHPPATILNGKVESTQATIHSSIEEFKAMCKDERIHVVVVLDMSDSMRPAAESGELQAALNKLFPALNQLDSREAIDCRAYAKRTKEMLPLTASNYGSYISEIISHSDRHAIMPELGWQTNEMSVMNALLRDYTGKEKTRSLVMFFSDGHAFSYTETERLLINSADKPIFWCFVGIGERDRPKPSKASGAFSSLASVLKVPANSMFGGPFDTEHYGIIRHFAEMSRRGNRNNVGFLEIKNKADSEEVTAEIAQQLISWVKSHAESRSK